MTPVSDSLLFVAQTTTGGGNPVPQFIFIGFMFAAMWFLIIAPQRKKQKQHTQMLAALDTGDEVVTAGGIYGEITSKKDDRFVVQIANGVKVEVAKAYVQEVIRKKG